MPLLTKPDTSAMRRYAIAAVAALGIAFLTGCDPKESAAPTQSAAPGVTSAAPAPAKKTLPKEGKCVLIPIERATSLLGSTPKASSASGVSSDEITHIDGCTYTATSNLGYSVNEITVAGGDPQVIIKQATVAMGQAPGAVKFDVPGGDASLGFTMAVGAKTMARIEVAKGKYTIGVNAVSADPAVAKQIALAAVQDLLAAI